MINWGLQHCQDSFLGRSPGFTGSIEAAIGSEYFSIAICMIFSSELTMISHLTI